MSANDPNPIGRPGSPGAATAPHGLSVLVVGRLASRDDALRRRLGKALAIAEFAADVAGAERLLPRCHFDCLVVEVHSASDPALGWIAGLRRDGYAGSVLAAAASDPALTVSGELAGATAVLPLPIDPQLLEQCLASGIPGTVARPAAPGARGHAMASPLRTQLIGDSAPIRRVRDMVERVAPTPATVLIEGQTGTGKELIARMLHERSGRRGAFVPVNCGAIPPELMESELFGHARGAFTGAHQQRDGLFVAARGGTLFLDEVSEMRSDLQVKLLRALEESRIRPVGADREVPIEVRIVASAQPGLRERVQEKRFREDLYYRLNVVHILLPGLRERTDDIPLLAQHFMQRIADEFGMTPVALETELLARLQARPWPGNVRELRNFIERTVLMGVPPAEGPDDERPADSATADAFPLEWTLEQVKQAHILRVLAQHEGNRSAAARQLGVSRKTLERRLGPGGPHGADD